jgi:signal recognition particle subunit SRP54
MVLEKLGSSLRGALKKIANASHIDKGLVKEVVRDIQRALLQADVNVEMVLSLTKGLERRALTEKPPPGMSPREHVIRIIYDELVKTLGEAKEVKLEKQRIMLVGLYGQGKTTTAGKLAVFYQRRGLRVAFIAADTHRPAAYDQLEQIASQVKAPIYGDRDEKSAEKIVKRGLKKLGDADVLVVDTSGRHSLEDDLIQELKNVSKILMPDETVLVLDATVGQQAGPQARAFHDAVGVTSVILTKLDGTAKGGGALSAVAETGAPISFIGTGEHLDDFESFDPAGFISRLLGMGDLRALMEAAEGVVDEGKAEETARRLLSGKFTLLDMYDQMEMISKMGRFKTLLSMIPGMGGAMSDEDLRQTQERLRRFKIIMDSMTVEEKTNPRLIKSSRVSRIARGSGTTPRDVKELLRHYNTSKKAIKGLAGNRKMRRQLMKQLESGKFDFMR